MNRFGELARQVIGSGLGCVRWLGIGVLALGLMLAGPRSITAGEARQTDWSAGTAAGAVTSWDGTFSVADGVSWLAVPGQLTLSGSLGSESAHHIVADDFARPASLDVADIDGDGDPDLVGAAFGGNMIRWWRNEGGQPPSWTPLDIETGFRAASSVRVADVNADGEPDVVGCAWNDHEVAVWFNDGQGVSWTRQSVATGFRQCHWVDVADVDGDGDIDLMGAAAQSNAVAVWLNDGALPAAWSMQVIDDAYGGARSLVPADFDGDGDVDLVGTALVDNDLSWWRNDGGDPLVFTREIISPELPGSHHAGAWDMDLDGDLDIVGLGYDHPYLKIWWNDGGDPLVWREEEIGSAILSPLVVGAGDLDGDGDMDVAATSHTWNRVMWWLNDGGPPGEWSSETLAQGFANAWPLAIADIDRNGSLDVLSGASGASEVAWWRLTDFVEHGTLASDVLEISDNLVSIECSLDVDTPAGTAVTIEIRTGSTADSLGGWVSLTPDVPMTLMERGPVFLQYRLRLSTSDPSVAPVVSSIAFEWVSEMPPRSSSGRRGAP